jgi:hypothetical protein
LVEGFDDALQFGLIEADSFYPMQMGHELALFLVVAFQGCSVVGFQVFSGFAANFEVTFD